MDDLRQRLEIASEAAQRAGELTLKYFRRELEVERKDDASPVTVADRETEAFLKRFLRERFPEDALFGEESGEDPGTSGYRWVLDPIDGTKSFIHGVPLYGVMVGLEDSAGDAVVGAVAIPALGDLVVAGRGLGCTWNGAPAAVSQAVDLAESTALYTGDECFEMTGTTAARDRIRDAVRVVRGWGDCYGHLMVATGRADIMLDPILADWDCVALLPIIEEAGGVFTDWKGQRTARGKSAVSTNAALAAEVRELLQSDV